MEKYLLKKGDNVLVPDGTGEMLYIPTEACKTC